MPKPDGRTTAIMFRIPNAAFDRLMDEADAVHMRPQDLARQMVLDGIEWERPAEEEERR